MSKLRATKCLLKDRYFSEFMANHRCADINLEHGYDKLRVYHCQSCGFYHLTSQNK